MGSEAITQNDLKNVLDAVLPVKPSEFKKLLWTNPSPTATFSPQTVSLDLSEYDEVEIISKKTASEAFYFITNSTIGVVNDAFFIQGGVTFDRQIMVSTTGIEFTTAYYLLPSSSAITTDNNRCVPYQIYGIKYERVALPQLEVVPLQVATFQVNTSFVAGAGSVVFNTPLPEGAIIKSRCISLNPNAQWLYCGIHSVSASSTTVAYRNNFSSAFTGTMELSVFYEIAN